MLAIAIGIVIAVVVMVKKNYFIKNIFS